MALRIETGKQLGLTLAFICLAPVALAVGAWMVGYDTLAYLRTACVFFTPT